MAKQPDMVQRMLRELIDKVDGLTREQRTQREQLNVCIAASVRLEQVVGRLSYDINDIIAELGVQRRRIEAVEERS
jgi:type IV pilus biogenesis protein CpaD/CtpE